MPNLIPAKIEIEKLFQKYIDIEDIATSEKYNDFEIVVEKSKNAYAIKFYIHYNGMTYSCSYPNNKEPFKMELLECHLQTLDN